MFHSPRVVDEIHLQLSIVHMYQLCGGGCV